MRLWTIQEKNVWDYLRENEVYKADPKKSMPSSFDDPDIAIQFKIAYDWVVEKMTERVGSSPKDVVYPIWGWHQWYSRKKRMPDLRSYHADKGTWVRLELDIPEERVMLSRYSDWHLALSYCMAGPEEEEYIFEEFLCKVRRELGEKSCPYPGPYHSELVDTWDYIIDVPDDYDGPVQATFWELRRSDVKKVKIFTGRPRN